MLPDEPLDLFATPTPEPRPIGALDLMAYRQLLPLCVTEPAKAANERPLSIARIRKLAPLAFSNHQLRTHP
jgi:hypothetical protein